MLAEVEGPGGLWWLTLLTPYLVIAVVTALVVVLVIAAIVGFVLYRRARRDGRWSPLVLALRLETAPPGPGREILKLRLRVARDLYRARRAVAAGANEGGPIGDLGGLLQRAERAAAIIDQDLRIVAFDSDRVTLRERLGEARSRVDEFEQVTRRLTETASLTLSGVVDGSLSELRTDADRELIALRAGLESLDRIGSDDLRTPAKPIAADAPARRA